MYPNLIPSFIADKFLIFRNLNKAYKEGELWAGVLFVDISGFTGTTEQLMKNGKEGAEVLSNLINEIFSPRIETIYKNSGFITHFAGDAFCAVFPKDKNLVRRIFTSAQEILDQFIKQGSYKTKFGSFNFSVKIGISYGKVIWGIIFNQHQNAYYFRGEPLYQSAECEKYCQGNDIIFDYSIKSLIKQEKIKFTKIDNSKFKLKNIDFIFRGRKEIRKIKNQLNLGFYPEYLFNLSQSGDFRNVATCFISFSNETNIHTSLSKIIDLVHQYGGYFNNINFGDKGSFLLVFFGAPSTQEKIYLHAVDFVLEVNEIENFQPSIGISYGQVYSGFRGSRSRAEYICLGSVVNLSARLMKKAGSNQILTNHDLSQKINEEYQVKHIGNKKLKGFKNLQPIYKVLGKRTITLKLKYRTDLVGREKELNKLKDKINRSLSSSKKILAYIYGEPGIGKSRLLYELKENIPENIKIFEFQTDSILKKNFNCILTTFNKLVNHQEVIPRNFSLVKLKNNFLKFIENYNLQKYIEKLNFQLDEFFDVISSLFGFSNEKSFLSNLPPQDYQKQLIELVYLLLKILISKNKCILFIEDLHWMDFNSREVFNRLILDSKISSPFIITSRYTENKEKPAFDYVKGIEKTVIELKGLSKESEKIIIEKLLKNNISENLYINIHQKVQGNPFFLEQYCNFLVESNLLEFAENALKLTCKQIEIPTNINDMIMSRIDHLSRELKNLIFISSAYGSEIDCSLFTEILKKLNIKLKPKKFNRVISEGIEKNIWDKKDDDILIFHHILIKEVAYEMQSKQQLRQYHGSIGNILEKTYPGQPSFFSNLAYHYQKAGIDEKAIEYLEKAGDWDKKNYYNKSAIDHYHQLLNYNLPKPRIVNIKMNIAEIYTTIGEYAKVFVIYHDNLELSQNNSELQADNFFGLGFYYYNTGEYLRALSYYRKAKNIYKQQGYKKELIKIYLYTGFILKDKCKYGLAVIFYRKVQNYAKKNNDELFEHLALWNIAIIEHIIGNYPKALKLYTKEMRYFEKINDMRRVNMIKPKIAYLYLFLGNHNKAIQLLYSVIDYFKKINCKVELSSAYTVLGRAFTETKKYNQALDYLVRSLNIFSNLDDKLNICDTLGAIGVIYSKTGDLDNAWKYYQQQLNIARKIGNKRALARALVNTGLIFSKRGNFEKAIYYYKKSLAVANKNNLKKSITQAYNNLSFINYLTGNFSQALYYIDKAIELTQKMNYQVRLIEYSFSKAQILIKIEKFREADNINAQGIRLAQKINREDLLFQAKINKALILESKLKQSAIDYLLNIYKPYLDIRKKADIYFHLYQLTRKDKYKKKSLKLYHKSYQENPTSKIFKHIEILQKQKDD